MPDTPALRWERTSPYAETADTGYRVSVSDGQDGRKYSAWAPDVHYHAWPPAGQARITYPRGHLVPQRAPLLGIFATRDLARACCARDAAQRALG